MREQVTALKWVFLLQENVTIPLPLISKTAVVHEQGMPWRCPYAP
jgi:hypothetical protein